MANLVDGSDPDFNNISFVHSMHKQYLMNWPELPKKSAILLIDYFKEKFKNPYTPGLYNITNIGAAICYSLKDVDGIGYASTSDQFRGYNIALKNFEKLKCIEVERWLINKTSDGEFKGLKLSSGEINDDNTISW